MGEHLQLVMLELIVVLHYLLVSCGTLVQAQVVLLSRQLCSTSGAASAACKAKDLTEPMAAGGIDCF